MRLAGLMSGGGGAPVTPVDINTTYERFGHDGGGGGTVITAGASINTKGAWSQLNAGGAGGALAGDIFGAEIFIQTVGSASTRGLVDIGVGPDAANVTTIIPNIFAMPGLGYILPHGFDELARSAGEKLWARWQSQGVSATVQVHGIGQRRVASHPPGVTSYVQLGGGTALSVPNTVDVTGVSAPNTGWTTVGTLAAASKSILLTFGLRASAANPGNTQKASGRLGYGGVGATDATWFSTLPITLAASGPFMASIAPRSVRVALPAGTRIAVEVLEVTPGDIIAPQVFVGS